MKRTVLLFLVGLMMVGGSCEPKKIILLFNEKNLQGWNFQLATDAIPVEQVFNVKKQIIHITGKPHGYMYTDKEYENYRLHVEWRWVGEAVNSGIFLHAQPFDTLWHGLPFPTTIECQLKTGNAGDIVLLGDARMDDIPEGTTIKEKQHPSNEKPAGEWNHADIICRGNTITVYINGQLQNTATGTNYSKGSIGLQSEGSGIEFRNITLSPFDKPWKHRK